MKKTMILLTFALTFACRGSFVLWVGMDETATVSDRLSSANFLVYLSSYANSADIGGCIRIDGDALPAGYEDSPGQNPPSVSFDDDVSEFGLLLVDETGSALEPPVTSNWQPVKLPDDVDPKTAHVKVSYDIGYWDESNDWNFVKVATAEEWLDVLYNQNHIYEVGTLMPPIETPWRPLDYRTVIPEPSTGALFLLGTVLLFKRRKA